MEKQSANRCLARQQFSWANTLIDPSSVELKFLTNADKLDVLDTTFPHAKPQMLYWNVQSEIDGEAKVQITYFTSGITWSADYLCIADKNENEMSFEGFVRVFNNSGEEYEHAQVRLVVGKINLVEKIAQLANISVPEVAKMDAGMLGDRREGTVERSTFSAWADRLCRPTISKQRRIRRSLQHLRSHKAGANEDGERLRMDVVSLV